MAATVESAMPFAVSQGTVEWMHTQTLPICQPSMETTVPRKDFFAGRTEINERFGGNTKTVQ